MRFVPGCGCCGISACGCPSIPGALHLTDDFGSHTIPWVVNRYLLQFTATYFGRFYINSTGTCGPSTLPIDITYGISCAPAPSKWTLSLNYRTVACTPTPGYLESGSSTGGTNLNNIVVQSDEVFSCSPSIITFHLPTTFNGLPVPGGGGTLTAIP